MLCLRCRRQVGRDSPVCARCGAPVRRAEGVLELVLADGSRVPLVGSVTIGRAAGNTVRLADPSVSRGHARIVVDGGAPTIEDAGSSAGTYVDGRRLAGPAPIGHGSRIRLGDTVLSIERRRSEQEAGRTIVVPPGASLIVPRRGQSELSLSQGVSLLPRVRGGWALKRLEAAEGDRRYVLKDLRGGDYVRMDADDAALFELLDGRRSLPDLIAESERRLGAAGPTRLARLLAELGERGLLAGVEERADSTPASLAARLLRPRTLSLPWLGESFERAYRAGGFLFFTRPAYAVLAALGLGGLGAFGFLVAARYGTPFVVARKIGLGAAVFLVGRFLVVALHELAHGLTVASFGRRVPRAGFKVMTIFPYAFVDTSEAWFEPRRRRIAVSAAGPAADLVVGGSFALGALALGGTSREIAFQLALAAYTGAFFNLNPMLERDGYHVLVDLLRQPGLRRRARERLSRALAGGGAPRDDPAALRLYGAATALWSLCGLVFAVAVSLHYHDLLAQVAPRPAVWAALAVLYVGALVPAAVLIGPPLVERFRRERIPEVGRAAG